MVLKQIREKKSANLEAWITTNLPDNCSSPFADFHKRFLRWVDKIEPGKSQEPIVEAWGRGLGKTSLLEAAIGYVAEKGVRKFCLYVSSTSDLAMGHLKEIAENLTQLDLEQDLDQNGKRVTWNRKELRIKGFSVRAAGLNEALRGIKRRGQRPDWIIFDDIDDEYDTVESRDKKIDAMTKKVMPTRSTDCVFSFLQNVIYAGSIMDMVIKGTAPFLSNRPYVEPVPAVYDAVPGIWTDDQGKNHDILVSGRAAWEGMPFDVCQEMVMSEGWPSFRKERLHITDDQVEYFFDTRWWNEENEYHKIIDRSEMPPLTSVCMGWDLAATEGGGDFTAGVIMGLGADGVYYVDHVLKGQWSAEKVESKLLQYSEIVANKFPHYVIRIPQDPAQAGVYQVNQLGRKLAKYQVRFEVQSGSKAQRARGYAGQVNIGNVRLVRGPWNEAFIEEHKQFRDEKGYKGHDDQIDGSASAWNQLSLELNADQLNRWASQEEEEEIEFATTETDPGPPPPWLQIQWARMERETEDQGPVAMPVNW